MAVIDAYEIGIQLLLQEDVSAGLAVINRGLAEVDRAIAATSADLAGLVREAEAATKAVAVATGGRTALDSTVGKKATGDGEASVQAGSGQEPSAPSVAASREKVATPEARAAEPVAPTRPTASQSNDRPAWVETAPHEQAGSSSAPMKSTVGETVLSGPRATTTQPEPATTVVVAPAQTGPTAPNASADKASPSRETAAGVSEPRPTSMPRAPQLGVTASINRERRSATVGAGVALRPVISDPATRRERPAAPWSGAEYAGQQTQAMRLHERAAAPQSPGRHASEAGGGTVMLDGRLVGQWLSEHMGREASRPPAGTSFFDPRQTPAWNVSGAML